MKALVAILSVIGVLLLFFGLFSESGILDTIGVVCFVIAFLLFVVIKVFGDGNQEQK